MKEGRIVTELRREGKVNGGRLGCYFTVGWRTIEGGKRKDASLRGGEEEGLQSLGLRSPAPTKGGQPESAEQNLSGDNLTLLRFIIQR
jgi:hypothetical protein